MAAALRASALTLALDHDAVLSAWEKIGGNVFSCEDMIVPEDPQEMALDLSLFEPPSSKEDSLALFGFGQSDLCAAPPAPLARSWSSTAHVVPACPMAFCPPGGHPMLPFPMLPRHMVPPMSMGFAPGPVPAAPPPPAQQPLSNVFSFESDDDVLEVPVMPCIPKAEELLQEVGPVASLSSCASDAGVVPDVTSPAPRAQSAVQFQQLPVGHNGLASCSSNGTTQQMCPQQLAQQQARPQARSAAGAEIVHGADIVRTRAECLERYRQKKARRMFTKKIRYQLRKINADKRPRIKGRFVKKEANVPAQAEAEAAAEVPCMAFDDMCDYEDDLADGDDYGMEGDEYGQDD